MTTSPGDLPYRPCAGFMLLNEENRVFVGQRIEKRAHGTWQMPQGGIDPGEDKQSAALRELGEETGITPDLVEIITPASKPLRYDLPPELLGKVWKGKYRGQEQHWFLGRFLGSEGDIDLEAHDPPEFNAYRWIEPEQLPELIIPFKRQVYREILGEFRDHLPR
ncbi:putative (di)nucleoside polyphosphate hydrolase [Erythrobacter litoralis]|uniref:RNA pyrophosphohydrolase n=1 Tax=Erythrobacter litoralis TaxID=39960 RepID=A0A074MGB3_9SPHN|nr:RNA pyrophosphohydrolase [Erythrobacter litoralis]AOL23355.1 putative (di)nucleoside polyphosphate hydrolase [Erythrobacter litoralis]KEO92499.1 RNA pyrophosphohydrolase [Erythrobacter litoralis]